MPIFTPIALTARSSYSSPIKAQQRLANRQLPQHDVSGNRGQQPNHSTVEPQVLNDTATGDVEMR